MTISEYLKGKVAITVSDELLNTILFDRNIPEGNISVQQIQKRLLDLCSADLFKAVSLSPATRFSKSDADGNWSHSEGGWRLTSAEKKMYLASANRIYKQYGEEEVVVNTNNVIKITKL